MQKAPVLHQTAVGLADNSTPSHVQIMELWKRVNPGVMPQYAQTPPSTVQDHFKWNQEEQEPVNFRHHFKKTVSSCLSMLPCCSSAETCIAQWLSAWRFYSMLLSQQLYGTLHCILFMSSVRQLGPLSMWHFRRHVVNSRL